MEVIIVPRNKENGAKVKKTLGHPKTKTTNN